MYVDSSGHEPITIAIIILLGFLIGTMMLSVDSPSAEITGATIEKPSFLAIGEKGITIFSTEFRLGKKNWYLDDEKESSFYFSGFTLDFSIGIPYNISDFSDMFSFDAFIFEFGLDTKYFDINIPLGIDPEILSIDIHQILKDIRSFFKNL